MSVLWGCNEPSAHTLPVTDTLTLVTSRPKKGIIFLLYKKKHLSSFSVVKKDVHHISVNYPSPEAICGSMLFFTFVQLPAIIFAPNQ